MWTKEIERQSSQTNSLRTGKIIIRDGNGNFICKVHHSKADLILDAVNSQEAHENATASELVRAWGLRWLGTPNFGLPAPAGEDLERRIVALLKSKE